jgi:hypothetical protein
LPYKRAEGSDDLECGVVASIEDERCHARTPEISHQPPYTLHFVEFDDQGWLYPDEGETQHAHRQIDRAVDDIRQRLEAKQRVLLLVFVHGWKHSAAYDDRDVKRFRQMLADAADLDAHNGAADGKEKRSVVGIYVGWRGAGALSRANPLVYLTFWTRKNAALHISEGASRELFARIRALRERVNSEDAPRPRLRTVVIGHSFGAWIAYSALSPSILELLATPLDTGFEPGTPAAQMAWRRARLRQAADMVVLVNAAFEASRYQPMHHLAQRLGGKLPGYEPPVLVLVTSAADRATRQAFPLGRFFNTIFQHPFASDEQAHAAKHVPGFMESYRTHQLTRRADAQVAECAEWQGAPEDARGTDELVVTAGNEAARKARMRANALSENLRHAAWQAMLASHDMTLPAKWTWQYCGGAFIEHVGGEPRAPVWNVLTDASLVRDHSDIMGEPLHAFLRQLYLNLPR